MRWRLPFSLKVAILAACFIHLLTPAIGAGEALSRGVSDLVFHLNTYDEHFRPLQHGQGLVIGPRSTAIVSVSTLEGSSTAVATMMNNSNLYITEVLAVDEVSGLAKVRLEKGAPAPSDKPVESGPPRIGEGVIFSSLTEHSEQVCVVCGITSVRGIPDLEDIYYVETSQPLPQPGGAVFSSEGRMVGIVFLRFGDRRTGLVASGARLSHLAGKQGQKAAVDVWADHQEDTWANTLYARYMAGQVALWEGQPLKTIDLIEDHVRSDPQLRLSMTALLGEAYMALDFLPEAIQAFKAAIDLDSPPGRVYQKLAWAYLEAGQKVPAEAMCLEAIVKDPDHSSGYTLLAHLRNLQGNHKQAVYEARRALIRKPDCPCAHFERGRGYIGLGRYDSAIDSLVSATTLDPAYGEAFNSLGYAYLRNDMSQHAVVALEEAVKLDPEMSEAWASLGEAYARADFPAKAIDALRLSVCLDPSGSHGYCRLAGELIKQGSYADAIDIIRQGLDRCEDQQWLVYYLGKAFLGQGRTDLARVQAERLCRENSELAGQLTRVINSGNDS